MTEHEETSEEYKERKSKVEAMLVRGNLDLGGTRTRAINALLNNDITSVADLIVYGRQQLLRGPNTGLKTVNWIGEAVFGGNTNEHWSGEPPAKKPTGKAKIDPMWKQARRTIAELRRDLAHAHQMVHAHERALTCANDYNERMRQTCIDVTRALERLRGTSATSQVFTYAEANAMLQLIIQNTPQNVVHMELSRAKGKLEHMLAIMTNARLEQAQ